LALLFGLCIVQVTFSSNYADLHADARSGRRSVMVRFGIDATKRTVIAIGAAFWLVYAAALWWHALPLAGMILLALIPLHWQALRQFLADAPLEARRSYFLMNRLLAALVLTAIVVDGLVLTLRAGATT
jgi:1,4-dihydroxy-2-naphthoate octaprenyltransferase